MESDFEDFEAVSMGLASVECSERLARDERVRDEDAEIGRASCRERVS